MKRLTLRVKLHNLRKRRKYLEDYILNNYSHILAKKESVETLSNIGGFDEIDSQIKDCDALLRRVTIYEITTLIKIKGA